MFVSGRCLPIEEYINACINQGAKSIELHLTKNYYDRDFIPNNVLVTAIHPSSSAYYLTPHRFTTCGFKEDVSYLYNLCKYFKEKQGRTPSIILHMQDDISDDLALSLVDVVDDFNRRYSITPKILMENVIPYSKKGVFNNGFYLSPVRFAKLCNQASHANQFGTCLDIAHAIGSINIINMLGLQSLQFDDYLCQYADTCKLVHLSGGRGFTLHAGSDRLLIDDWFVHYFYSSYKKFGYKADITIDVHEDDYTTYENFRRVFDVVNKCIKQYED